MLTRGRIIDAALGIAGEQGFAALSTREISTVLGVSPMAIYRHVPSMEQLRADVADVALSEVEMPPGDLPPRDRLRHVLLDVHRVCRRYDGLSLTAAAGPATSALHEALRSALREAGFPAGDDETRLRLLVAVLIGARELEHRGLDGPDGPDRPRFDDLLDLALAALDVRRGAPG